MGRVEFTIRPATDADIAAAAQVSTLANPDDPPVTAEILRWVWSRAIPERPHAHLVAESGGEVVGSGILRGVPDVPFLVLYLDVDPDHQGQGIGHALLEALVGLAGEETEVAVIVSAASPGAIRFAERHGFVELARRFESTLDLAGFDPAAYDEERARLVGEGYRFSSLAEEDRPQLRRALHRLHTAALKDVPSATPFLPTTYAEWERDWIKAPHAIPPCFAIAFWKDKPAAFSYVISQSEGVGYMWMTAVARTHRSKGLGLAVKVHALRAAAAMGLSEVMTNNDPDNAPMLAINRRLGFRDRPARIDFKKTLSASLGG